MEQARYWMWTRRELNDGPRLQSSHGGSWEEQAFAEDSGVLGGCIWPPRSYSCSFCGREFRSAQALGGHMNVHRRERARLKQSPNPHTEINRTPFGRKHPSQICSREYQYLPAYEDYSQKKLVSPPYSPSFLSVSPPISAAFFSVSDSKIEDRSHRSRVIDSTMERNCSKADFAVDSSNFDTHRGSCLSDSGDDEDKGRDSKRRRKDAFLPASIFSKSVPCGRDGKNTCVPLFIKPNGGERFCLQSEMIRLGSSPIEDLDLELRLGDRPKVK